MLIPEPRLYCNVHTHIKNYWCIMAADEDKEHIDSEEEDEDYVPGVDPNEGEASDDEDAAGGGGATEDDGPIILSITKQKAVDDAFYDLFGYHYTATNNTKSNDKIPTKSKHTITKQKRILSSIFGNRSCNKLINNAKSIASLARAKPSSGGMLRLEKRTITEVKRFAGQEIKIEKVVMVPVMLGDDNDEKKFASQSLSNNTTNNTSSTATTSSATAGRKAKGVDNLLHEMAKPEKLSTVAKTSADWDLFKSKNADASLKEQLESQATGNDAYLVKKDFLNRVDERRFEAEKAERERSRAKRGK